MATYKELSNKWGRDRQLPERAFRLENLNRMLDGTIYEILEHPFHCEKNRSGQYIPLPNRQPCVKVNLVRTAVSNSASMLFSEGHFPKAKHDDRGTRTKLSKLVKETCLNETMLDAVIKGSVGSVFVLVRVLKGRLFFKAKSTTYLTPTWDPEAPDTLLSVAEQYKVLGEALIEAGYKGDFDQNQYYWLRTVWDTRSETAYHPEPVVRPLDEADKPIVWRVDEDNTVAHNLGFLPGVWVKNLPGGDDIDGEPTMRLDAIDTSITLDYLLSQNNRGLRYNLDPKLVIKEPPFQGGGPIEGDSGSGTPMGAENAIVLDANGDAKLLELTGGASDAAIAFSRHLRELALESLGGNRASAEKLATAQSGKAMTLMNQTLVWLADGLRISYGEKGLQELLQLIIRISQIRTLVFKDGTSVGALASGNITLVWPDWYEETPDELQKKVETFARAVDVGLMSRETAIHRIADLFDIEDVEAEIKLVETMLAEREKAAEQQVVVQA